jgi:uncharacterized membrane protein
VKPWHRWLALGIAVAVLAHLLTVWALPRLIMSEAMTRIGEETSLQAGAQAREQGAPSAATGVYLPPPTDHTQRRIVMPSPDLLYATCALDLGAGPQRITAQVEHPRYWSVALYGGNSDNFFVVNDRKTTKPGQLDLWVVAPGTDRAALAVPAGSTVVEAPSAKSLLLMRLLVSDDPADLESAQRARTSLRCLPVATPR